MSSTYTDHERVRGKLCVNTKNEIKKKKKQLANVENFKQTKNKLSDTSLFGPDAITFDQHFIIKEKEILISAL